MKKEIFTKQQEKYIFWHTLIMIVVMDIVAIIVQPIAVAIYKALGLN